MQTEKNDSSLADEQQAVGGQEEDNSNASMEKLVLGMCR